MTLAQAQRADGPGTHPLVTAAHVERYAVDGVVKIEGAVDPYFIEPLIGLAEAKLLSPGRWATDSNRGAAEDRIFTERYLWRDEPLVRSFAFDSGVAALAGSLMRSAEARLYFDHLLVKQPRTAESTPWHQDIPYWPFLGSQIGSVWVALTACGVDESSLEFVRGSHRWDLYAAPVPFGVAAGFTAGFQGDACPDIDAARDQYDIVSFEMQPGDALVFSAWTLHGARGNGADRRRIALSTRWLGDDAVWHPHPGSDPTVRERDVCVRPGELARDDDRFPVAWRNPLANPHTKAIP